MEYFLQGFLVCAGLIAAIGAQNAFVLKQGLLKQHIFWVILTCILCDVILMSLSVLGLGSLISQSQNFTMVLAFVGAAFLLVYGSSALRSAYIGKSVLAVQSSQQPITVLKSITLTLAITLLNPHVYLDIVVIIGGIAGTLDFAAKKLFLMGAICTSIIWFFSLGYGARLLIPLFKRPMTWRILDGLIGIVMYLIALGLVKYGIELM